MVGIYKITNLIDGTSYIGQSTQIKEREKRHWKTAYDEKDHSYNNPLYRAIRKYGLENFSFEIIKECLVQDLNEEEKYWIKYYDTFFNGYNLTFGGDGSGTKEKKDSVIGTIIDLENTELSQREIAEKWKISEEMVQGINTGRYWRYDRKYPIRTPKKAKEYFCIDCGKQISKGSMRCRSCSDIFKKNSNVLPITREELKEKIRTTPFVHIAKEYNVSDNAIRKWCDKYNLPRRSKDIKSYSNEEWDKV